MINALDGILAGDPSYPAAFKEAHCFWDEFFRTHSDLGRRELLVSIEAQRVPFQCAVAAGTGLDIDRAAEIMTLTCVGAAYQKQATRRDLAQRVVHAIGSSKIMRNDDPNFIEAAQLYDLCTL